MRFSSSSATDILTTSKSHPPYLTPETDFVSTNRHLSAGTISFFSWLGRGNEQGAMYSLRKELGAGQCPLPETMIALVRLSGSKENATRGLEILVAMEKLDYDIRQAWLILVEELMRTNHLEEANKVFLKGARGGMRATDQFYDLMIGEDCKAGDHSNALDISYEMEAAGRMATTFDFNCLLSVQATCGIPEVAYATFENMEYGEVEEKEGAKVNAGGLGNAEAEDFLPTTPLDPELLPASLSRR